MSDEPTREEREAKVIAAVREWLPDLEPGMMIHIEALEPSAPQSRGDMFGVRQTRVFTCRRGSDS
jgi:hypothetical protein